MARDDAKIKQLLAAEMESAMANHGVTPGAQQLRRGRHRICSTSAAGVVCYARVNDRENGLAIVVGPLASLSGNIPPSLLAAWTGGNRGENPNDPTDSPVDDVTTGPPERRRP